MASMNVPGVPGVPEMSLIGDVPDPRCPRPLFRGAGTGDTFGGSKA